MGSKNSSPTSIVPQLLMGYNFKNYENWKMCMKSYLLGEDLWDIVDGTESQPESTQPEFKTWRKKDGKALHAIQISCGEDMLDQIREKYSAKAAWDHLAFVQLPDTVDKKLASHKEASSSSTSQGKEDGYAWCLPLYQAVYNGDWKNAKKFLDLHPDAVTSSLSDLGDTALHIAAVAGHEQLVEELVKLMPEEKDLEKKNLDGITALSVTAVGGVTKMAEAMVSKNTNLVRIRNQYNLIPVVVACYNGHKDMVRYLYSKTPKEELSPETGKDGATLLTGTIISDIYDVALDLLRLYPKLAVAVDSYGDTAVTVLARKPYAFPSGTGYNIWQRWIYSCMDYEVANTSEDDEDNKKDFHNSRYQFHMITQVLHWFQGLVLDSLKFIVPGVKQIQDKKLMNIQALKLLKCLSSQIQILDVPQLKEAGVYAAIFQAVKFGIVEFIVELLKCCPHLIWSVDNDNRRIFSTAIVHRQEKIFNLIYGMGVQKNEIAVGFDKFDNSMLHLAGMLAPPTQLRKVSGAALQMQRELQWFQEVEKIMQPKIKDFVNIEGKTPRILFTEAHKDLVKEGEKWLKDTSASCMVVATLIATVMFAAAFTIPGENKVFIVSDALSLFSSSTSVLMFLSILTSRYAEEDFLKSLPKRLIIGLATLFFSIATMMIAFGATLFIVLGKQYTWITLPIILLASVPVSLFALLQFPLFLDIVTSTYGSGIFRPHTRRWQY